MNKSIGAERSKRLMSTLPGDDVRQIMWRFADRYELHMLVDEERHRCSYTCHWRLNAY